MLPPVVGPLRLFVSMILSNDPRIYLYIGGPVNSSVLTTAMLYVRGNRFEYDYWRDAKPAPIAQCFRHSPFKRNIRGSIPGGLNFVTVVGEQGSLSLVKKMGSYG